MSKYYIAIRNNKNGTVGLPMMRPGYSGLCGFKSQAACQRFIDRESVGHGRKIADVYSVQGQDFNGLKTGRDHDKLWHAARKEFSQI